MNVTNLWFLLLLIAVFIDDIEGWRLRRRRRRRRRRGCSPINCRWHWGGWSSCNCNGKRSRYAVIAARPSCGGSSCPNSQAGSCPVPIKHCTTNWGSWSTCTCEGMHSRRTVNTQQPACGGTPCPMSVTATKLCIPSSRKNCLVSWGSWSPCSCNGLTTRSTVIQVHPKCGGTGCPITVGETKSCVPKARRNCLVSWGGWSSCSCNGLTTRATVIKRHPRCGGTRCPMRVHASKSCVPTGRKNCKWSWGVWSTCTCRGIHERHMSITQKPKCGGRYCPRVQKQSGRCATSFCVHGAGICVRRRKTDVCRCNPGKTGLQCQKNCPSGKYGFNCSKRCNCISGVSCDPRDGFCKCPVGRSGRRCQFMYKCANGSICYNIRNPKVNYRFCFIQHSVSYTAAHAMTSCPAQTHYANRCICHPNCVPSSLYNSRQCNCKCRDNKTKKFITAAICCPKRPYF